MSLTGAGFGMFLSPNARLIIGSAPIHRAAAAGGLISTTRMVGQTTGATLVAALLATGIGGGYIPPLVAAGLAPGRGAVQHRAAQPRDPQARPAETEQAMPAEVR